MEILPRLARLQVAMSAVAACLSKITLRTPQAHRHLSLNAIKLADNTLYLL
jgi:hypothetical protein